MRLQHDSIDSLKTVVHAAGLKFTYFLSPLILTMIGAVLESSSLGFFIPIFRGLSDNNFSFLYEYPIIGDIARSFPFLFGGSPVRTFSVLCAFVGLGVVFRILLGYYARVHLLYRSKMLAHKLRVSVMGKSMTFGKQYFDTHSIGSAPAMIDSYSHQVADQSFYLMTLVSQICPVLFYVIAMALVSWQVTLVLLLSAPVFFWALRPISRWMIASGKENAVLMLKFGSSLQRITRAISVIKASHTGVKELQQFEKISDEMRVIQNKMSQKNLLADLFIQLTIIAGVGIAAFTLLLFLRQDFATMIPRCVVYMYLLRVTVDIARSWNRMTQTYATLLGICGKLCLYLDESDKFIQTDGTEPFNGVRRQLDVANLTWGYHEGEKVLHDINLTIPKGSVVALVGPSGSGKSTLVQLMMRLYDSPPGTVFIDGKDIREYRIGDLRRQIAYVNQRANLLEDSLRNNLTYGCTREVAEEELLRTVRSARLEQVVENLPFGLETMIGSDGIRLSGGEAQRVAIARAMIKGCELLVLDEATSALDATTERLIQEAIEELVIGKTVVVIAHRFSTLQNADLVIAMNHGRIVECGTLAQLLNQQGLFAELWRAQELTAADEYAESP